jgi:hypothetical protein
MNRGLIIGAIAFVAAFAAERLFSSLGPDIARYNRIREMSGQEPLFKEILAFGGSLLGSGGPSSFINETTQDVIRYAKMKGM